MLNEEVHVGEDRPSREQQNRDSHHEAAAALLRLCLCWRPHRVGLGDCLFCAGFHRRRCLGRGARYCFERGLALADVCTCVFAGEQSTPRRLENLRPSSAPGADNVTSSDRNGSSKSAGGAPRSFAFALAATGAGSGSFNDFSTSSRPMMCVAPSSPSELFGRLLRSFSISLRFETVVGWSDYASSSNSPPARFCGWGFDARSGTGPSAAFATSQVQVSRLPASRLPLSPRPASASSTVAAAGLGELRTFGCGDGAGAAA